MAVLRVVRWVLWTATLVALGIWAVASGSLLAWSVLAVGVVLMALAAWALRRSRRRPEDPQVPQKVW